MLWQHLSLFISLPLRCRQRVQNVIVMIVRLRVSYERGSGVMYFSLYSMC